MLVACGGSDDVDADPPLPDGWAARVLADTPALVARPDGCLEPTDEVFLEGDALPILAADDRYAIVDEIGTAVEVADLALHGDPPESGPAAVVQLDTVRYTYDDRGCPVEGEPLVAGTPVLGLSRSFTANYRGFAVIDHQLGLAEVRVVDREGWDYPWHASVQLVYPIDGGGFVVGGGVLLGPETILTAAHLGVDETWCVCRGPNTGDAYYGGACSCTAIGSVEAHPDGVDAAKITLVEPEPEPWGFVGEPVAEGETFVSSQWGSLTRHLLADSKIARVGADNAWCDPWPMGSSFVATDLIVGPGDSGGPAWKGDGVVGLVHGEACTVVPGPTEHVFVHVPGIAEWFR